MRLTENVSQVMKLFSLMIPRLLSLYLSVLNYDTTMVMIADQMKLVNHQ